LSKGKRKNTPLWKRGDRGDLKDIFINTITLSNTKIFLDFCLF
jgi:hypothetical protein